MLWQKNNNAGGIKCGSRYCSYTSKEQGVNDLKSILKGYVERHGFNLKNIRNEYCGSHCGGSDLKEFNTIFMEELNENR